MSQEELMDCYNFWHVWSCQRTKEIGFTFFVNCDQVLLLIPIYPKWPLNEGQQAFKKKFLPVFEYFLF